MSPIDEKDREAARLERALNVLIDAGAGTGKTTLIVDRFIEQLAPSDGSEGTPISRLAAVTFTRRAAGELRLRIREGILRSISDPKTVPARRKRLQQALGGLDSAWIGTIHSFADRLLRLEPMASGLSPTYEILEDADELHFETWDALREASERGQLDALLVGLVDRDAALEAQATFLGAMNLGLLVATVEHDWGSEWGLDALVSGFINHRDAPPKLPEIPAVDFGAFEALVSRWREAVLPAGNTSAPQRLLHSAATRLENLLGLRDELRVLAELRELARTGKDLKARMGVDFEDDDDGWEAWKVCFKGGKDRAALLDQMRAPFDRWLSCRLVRTFPVVIAMFERVKARWQVLDQIDLLLQLRNVLRDHPDVRARYQRLFDHLFVDEFQDTDPLQAEVLMYLSEQGQSARSWKDVTLAPGKLTLVGDPKQSIYRFRRADVLMYDSVRTKVASGPHLAVSLRANFRSTPGLIDWFNERFERVLGKPPKKGVQFDGKTGAVFHAPLAAGVSETNATPVRHARFRIEDEHVGPLREAEAEMWARSFKRMVEDGVQVRDPVTGAWRRCHFGDFAVLAQVTINLPMLLDAFDRFGVPWSSRGGVLFLSDRLHQQFILGLRAIADREDGVAMMALLRPPFFAVSPVDWVSARNPSCPPDVEARVREVKEIIEDLRMRRFDRAPGDTARELLERSGFARHVAMGPNGAQRLERLRELCFLLDREAMTRGLDFDGATAALVAWVTNPPQLDAPHPMHTQVVQVLSIHQAKGLEYPIVALWDGQAKRKQTDRPKAWNVSRDGNAWSVCLKTLEWSEPNDASTAEFESNYAAAERSRLLYVAATRARDVLLLPLSREEDELKPEANSADALALGSTTQVLELEPWLPNAAARPPAWVKATEVPAFLDVAEVTAPDSWKHEVESAAAGTVESIAVSTEAQRVVAAMRASEEDEVAEPPAKKREGRFGRHFGSTVHRALAFALFDPALSLAEAVRRAAREFELTEHFDEAEADVERTLETLAGLGLSRGQLDDFAVEYPLAMPRPHGLLGGFIDLLAVHGGTTVIDFKTDAVPQGDPLAAKPEYAQQVRTYAELLEEGGVAARGTVKAALLFTQTGQLVHVPRGV